MKDSFIIEGKKYISSKRASAISDYASDYIGQLCRANKLDCRMIGRSWFVTEESIHLHKATISREESVRNRIENLKGKVDVVPDTYTKISINKNPAPAPVSVPTPVSAPVTSPVSTSTPVPAIPWTITETKPLIKSPYVYSNDNRPLLPELKKKEVAETKKVETKKIETKEQEVVKEVSKIVVSEKASKITKPVTKSVSESLIAKNSLSYFKLTRQIILQRAIAPALVLIVMFGVGTGTYILADKIESNISPEFTNSAKAVTANIYDTVGSVLLSVKNGYNNVVAFFTSPAKLAMDIPKEFGEVTVSKVTPNGIVLSSSVGSEEGDEALKNKIKGSFSDEVEINPDNSGTAGVITPVFKDTKGKDFVYVMVPVKEKDTKVTQ